MTDKKHIRHFEEKEIKTLVELLKWRAKTQPNKRAYTYLKDGKKSIDMTYGELDARARALAAMLQKKGLEGHRALLLYPPGLDYIVGFFGCLYANVIAVPAYPPDPNRLNRSLPRLQAIVNDSRSTIALTTDSILYMIRMLRLGNKVGNTLGRMPFLRKFRTTMRYFAGSKSGVAESHSLGDLEWLSTDKVPDSLKNDWHEPDITEDTIAFLQYTSGSTGNPKGVILTHYNLLANSKIIYDTMNYPKNGEGVFWIPIYHDMGLIGGVLQPLYGEAPSTLMSPITFLQHPLRWLDAINNISKDKVVATAAPNFAYELCIKKATPERIAHLDLSNWFCALSGAEPVRASTMDRFSDIFGKVGFKKEAFFPAYGLAEATLLVTGSKRNEGPVYLHVDKFALKKNKILEVPAEDENSQTLVSSGYSHPLQRLAIVNPDTFEECQPGEIGEIWVKGPSVSPGYYGRKEETDETFNNFIKHTNEGPFLRTGDLGFLKDNRLYVTGRVKDLIIIRGTNHYPQDIEVTVEAAHPLIRQGCSAAFTVEVNGQEELVVVAEVRQSKNANFSEAIDAIRQAIVENHDLQTYAVVLIKARTINKTSSGKIQRRATKEDFLNNELQVVAEWRSQATTQPPVTASEQTVAEEETPPAPPSTATKDDKVKAIEQWLVRHLAQNLGIAESQVDVRAPFISFGLDSAQAVGLAGDLEDFVGRSLPPTLIWDYPTIEELARYLASEEISTLAAIQTHPRVQPEEPIAIIGMGAKFPKAPDLQAFWQLLKNNVDGISEVPPDRWDADRYYSPKPDTPGKMITKSAGFVENVDLFDAHFFGISPREAVQIDPQQRLLLEVTWEAFEHAGLPANKVMGSRTGVFVGISTNDYIRLQQGQIEKINPYSGTGNAFSIAANRISYLFDLQGPSMAIDTACSSSLVAVHEAAQSLLNGDCDMAIAGGVNLILSPELSITFSQAHMLSPDGRCKTFDASADGYGRGEGAGVVILKRLSDAQKDGDRILAVIRGSAVNQDGKSNGITAPNGLAQQNVIRAALSNADLAPDEIQYVETHGTGTPLGDPIEIESLKRVLLQERAPNNPLYIGSVKTNIGHLESAAGIAGLIKTVLALYHEEIPAHLHFKSWNPHIKLNGAPLQIPTQNVPWKKGEKKRRAGVSAFGFGGTNAHIILEEAPKTMPVDEQRGESIAQKPFILPLSAKTESALLDLARSISRFTQTQLPETDNALYDLLYTSALKRTHLDQRLAVIAENREELIRNLQDFTEGKENKALVHGALNPNLHFKIAFVFSGQGPQWFAMGRELYQNEPVFKATIDRISLMLSEYTDWTLSEELLADESQSRLDETAIAQPALFAIQVALVALWRSWGILPDAVVGHSVGEVAAAHVSGILSLDTAVKVIFHRSRLMQQATGKGKMAAIDWPLEKVQKLIEPYADRLSIGAHNSVTSTVISGDEAAIDAVLAQLEDKDVFFKKLPVNYAFHSPVMDAYLQELQESLEGIQVHQMQIPIVSTVSGNFATETDYNAEYWAHNVRQYVHFSQAIERLIEKDYNVFIEIGPHPVLKHYIKQNLAAHSKEAIILPSLRRKEAERRQMLSTFATLYTLGYPLDWSRFYKKNGALLELPPYPFQRQRYWITDELEQETTQNQASTATDEAKPAHPLLGQETPSPFFPARTNWTIKLDSRYLQSFVTDPQLGASFLPETAYLEMAAAASKQIFGQTEIALDNLVFKNLFTLSENQNRELQFSLIPVSPKKAYFQAYSRVRNGTTNEWKLHSLGTINKELHWEQTSPVSLTQLMQTFEPVDPQSFSTRPGRFQSLLQSVEALWQQGNQLLAKMNLSQLSKPLSGEYLIDPFVINVCFQLMALSLSGKNRFLPPFTLKAIKSLKLVRPPEKEFWVYLNTTFRNGDISIEFMILDNDENILMQVNDLRFKTIPLHEALANISYTIHWKPLEISQLQEQRTMANRWLVFSDQSPMAEQFTKLLSEKGFECFTLLPGASNEQHQHQITLNFTQAEEAQQRLNSLITDNTEILYLWPLNSNQENERILRTLASRLPSQLKHFWLVTQNGLAINGQAATCDPGQALLGDLLFSLAPVKQALTQIDLDFPDARRLLNVLQMPLVEQKIALRGKTLYVERLKHQTPVKINVPAAAEIVPKAVRFDPDEQEVEVEIKAVGLNTRDVNLANENQPNEWQKIGIEFAGVVQKTGKGVTSFQQGQRVMGLIPQGLRQFGLTRADFLLPIPDHLSFEQAAALPFNYFTAHYALNYLAQLQPEEKVLILDADSAIGLALINVARAQDAIIFATLKEPTNKDLLNKAGVQHLFSSDTLHFIDDILHLTQEEGVDVIVNTYSNEKVVNSFALLKDFGRFIELNPRDTFGQSIVYHNLRYNMAFFAVDLETLASQQPRLIKRISQEVGQKFESKAYQPLPVKSFAVKQVGLALHKLQKVPSAEKFVLSLESGKKDSKSTSALFLPDARYLVVGTQSVNSLALLRYLLEQGVQHLDFLPLTRDEKIELPENVRVINYLDDAAFKAENIQGVFLNLDHMSSQHLVEDLAIIEATFIKTYGRTLDFFISLSRFTLPDELQQSDKPLNLDTYLLALHKKRLQAGLPSLHVQLGGPVPQELSIALGRWRILNELIPIEQGHLIITETNWETIFSGKTASDIPPIVRDLLSSEEQTPAQTTGQITLRKEDVLQLNPEERFDVIRNYLAQVLAKVIKIPASQINHEQPLTQFGIDSLMAIELKNTVESQLQISVPIATLLKGPSINDLTNLALDQIESSGSEETKFQFARRAINAREAFDFRLSHGQRAMYFQHTMNPQSVFNLAYAVRIRSEVDAEQMRDAFQKLVDRHPALRTTFHLKDGEPVQRIHPNMPVFFAEEDVQALNEEQIRHRLQEEVESHFDLENGPLMRIYLFKRGDQDFILLFVMHHIVTDIWSQAVLLDELSQIFEQQGDVSLLEPLAADYTDFIEWQEALLASEQGERLLAYWSEKLKGELPVLNLPTDRPRPPVQTFKGRTETRWLPETLSQRVHAFCEQQGLTPFAFLLSAYYLLLHRYTGQEDLIVGSPTAGRSLNEFNRTVGYFVNPLPIRVQVRPQQTVNQFLSVVKQTVLEVFEHMDYPLTLLVEKLQPKRDPSRTPLFQTMFVLERAHLMHDQGLSQFALSREGAQLKLGDLTIESMNLEQGVAPFDLTMMAVESGKGLAISLGYNIDLFEHGTIERLLSHYLNVIEHMLAQPEQPIARLDLLSPEEKQHLLHIMRGPQHEIDFNRTVIRLFEEQVARFPDKAALTFEGQQLTYQQLNEQANRLAHYLLQRNIKAEERIGICLNRSFEMIVSLFAVLKSGAAYVPIDPDYPTDRIHYMLQDANLKYIITQKEFSAKLNGSQNLLLIDELAQTLQTLSAENPNVPIQAENLAYIIYTSGSTGRPKGTLLQHAGLVNTLQATQQRYHSDENIRQLHFASFSFDASIEEILRPLVLGGTLTLVKAEDLLSLNALTTIINREKITHVTLPPSVLAVLPPEQFPTLKVVVSAGEKCTPEIARKWKKVVKHFVNGYGPTEATICTTTFEVPTDFTSTSVPIGRPIPNMRTYVLDASGNLVPQGVPGELYIAGIGLARGYLNRSDLTAERFVPDPFSNQPGARMYRTGDLVRLLKDGNLEFIDRVDEQIKIRGYRVELGEIESVIESSEQVKDAVVVAKKVGMDVRIVAYVIPEGEFDESALRTFLKQHIPDFMIPAHFVALQKFPLTANGKVDKRALPEPEASSEKRQIVRPGTNLERKLANIWKDVLQVDDISIYDSFFDLGGHSLGVIQIQGRVKEELDLDLDVVDIFKYPTIHGLAQYLENKEAQNQELAKSKARASRQREATSRMQQLRMMQQKRGGKH